MVHTRIRVAPKLMILAVAAAILAGCSSVAPSPTPAATLAAEPSAVDSPLAESSTSQSPLASPAARTPPEAPPSDPGLATVTGQLLWSGTGGVSLGELFLAVALTTSQEDVMMPSLDTETAPRALLDRSTGEFAFTNVPPGVYALVVWDPFNSSLVDDPETGETIFVTVQPDQALDLGTISLPGD